MLSGGIREGEECRGEVIHAGGFEMGSVEAMDFGLGSVRLAEFTNGQRAVTHRSDGGNMKGGGLWQCGRCHDDCLKE